MRVLFIWQVNDQLKSYLSHHPLKKSDTEFIFLPSEQLNKLEIPRPEDIQVVIGWIGHNEVSRNICRKLSNLELIINPGVGIEKALPVMRELNKNKHVTLCNSHAHTYFTAQHALGMLLTLSNCLLTHHRLMKDGKWRAGDKEGASLPLKYRKTGLLGYGPINQQAHQFLSGFKTDIHILKNSLNEDQEADPNFYTPDQLHDFLKNIDNLLIAVPHTKKTEGMIGREELELLGEKGILVNVARGSIVQEEAFYQALKKKTIFAAGSDVWYNYKPDVDEKGRKYPYSYPFHELDNMLLSPHRGGSPLNDLNRWDECMEILSCFENGRELFNVVNLDREY